MGELGDMAQEICIDIFNDFTHEEVNKMAPSLIKAWELGKHLTEGSED